ncbi:hypothetical protein V6N13_102834 [Hibiscus sabdariffa]|uniref:alpha-galactosidase n=1 Tax=Hibiscus sabdariffa TaxID=183260 RepID=A0ABR2D647_9ROSI
MLEVGNGGMTLEEYRSHFNIWALAKVWVGPLHNNKIVVVLWNRGSQRATVTALWSDIDLDPTVAMKARDL